MTMLEERPATGRPSLIEDAELVARIIEAVAHGANVKDSASAGPISSTALENWIKRGRTERTRLAIGGDVIEPNPVEAPFVEFVGRIETARSSALRLAATELWQLGQGKDVEETHVTEVVDEDGNVIKRTIVVKTKHVQSETALVAYLERSDPENWSKRWEHTGPGGGPIQVEDVEAKRERARRLVDDELARKREQRAQLPNDDEIADAEIVDEYDDTGIADAAGMTILGP